MRALFLPKRVHMADTPDPVFQIQRIYLKESSLEQPNSPAILLEQESPTVDIQLAVNASPAAEGIFEVIVTATVPVQRCAMRTLLALGKYSKNRACTAA